MKNLSLKLNPNSDVQDLVSQLQFNKRKVQVKKLASISRFDEWIDFLKLSIFVSL